MGINGPGVTNPSRLVGWPGGVDRHMAPAAQQHAAGVVIVSEGIVNRDQVDIQRLIGRAADTAHAEAGVNHLGGHLVRRQAVIAQCWAAIQAAHGTVPWPAASCPGQCLPRHFVTCGLLAGYRILGSRLTPSVRLWLAV